MTHQPRVAGVVVFKDAGKHVLIIESDPGNFGFPKGKKEGKESIYENAVRELQEESGITSNQVQFLNKAQQFIQGSVETQSQLLHVDEIKAKTGNISSRYLIAALSVPETSVTLQAAIAGEILQIKFMTIPEALKVLSPQRRDVVNSAFAKLPRSYTTAAATSSSNTRTATSTTSQ